MRKLLFVLLLALVGTGAFFAGRWQAAQPAGASAANAKPERKILYWHDPMHPSYTSHKPGIAPDCGMRLEPVYADSGSVEAPKSDNRKILYWADPNNPNYKSDKPGLDPETGADLQPVYEENPAGTVYISPEKQQLIGVAYGTVEYASTNQSLRAVGRVAVDETRISRVHSKVEGWVDKVYADFTGKVVTKGQPLVTLYSPEMLASQKEYLIALKARDVMKHSMIGGMHTDAVSMVDAARQRLELWDLGKAQIEELERSGQPVKNITIYSPVTGVVTERSAFPNQKIGPEMPLATIADLSQVWINADVFEYEAPRVRVGQTALVSQAYGGSRQFRAKVSYILPQVDPATRSLKVRLEAPNPSLQLKPDMFVDVDFQLASAPVLSVPSTAVIDTGERQTVFVARADGHFEPRPVQIGQRFADRIEILGGLKQGERIVTSGNFLIDSESQLKAAAAGMSHHD